MPTEIEKFIETAFREDYANRTEEYEELYAHKTEKLSVFEEALFNSKMSKEPLDSEILPLSAYDEYVNTFYSFEDWNADRIPHFVLVPIDLKYNDYLQKYFGGIAVSSVYINDIQHGIRRKAKLEIVIERKENVEKCLNEIQHGNILILRSIVETAKIIEFRESNVGSHNMESGYYNISFYKIPKLEIENCVGLSELLNN